MSYRIHTTGRAAMEQLLAQRAEDLLRARAAKTGLRPRTLLAQTLPLEQTEKNQVVQQLLARLKERDG